MGRRQGRSQHSEPQRRYVLRSWTVFTDPLSIIVDDDEHSIEEQRFLTVGLSREGSVLIVSYAEREDVVRIISAREAKPKEIRAYEEAE